MPPSERIRMPLQYASILLSTTICQLHLSCEEKSGHPSDILIHKEFIIKLFASSTATLSNEARQMRMVDSESCPIPSQMTEIGMFLLWAMLAQEWRATHTWPRVQKALTGCRWSSRHGLRCVSFSGTVFFRPHLSRVWWSAAGNQNPGFHTSQ